MISDYIKKIEEWYGKEKKDKIELDKKYWKLPATERIHYDSCVDSLEKYNFNPLIALIKYIKMCVFIPLFFIIAGYIGGVQNVIIPLSREIMFGLLGFTKYALALIMILYFWNLYAIEKQKKIFKRKFKLIK